MKYLTGIILTINIAVGTVYSRELAPSLTILKGFIAESGSLSWDIYEGLILGL
jgi:hypothetical protein